MDFDTVKENIQPLRQGRNAERLGIALNAESQEILQKELFEQRKEYELSIQQYKGQDPLDLWYEYISWIEQSYPKSGKETHLDEVLIKCIETFEHFEQYRQDRRMIKIYMKYIDSQSHPQNLYQELFNQGIGTMVADLYIGWAYYYDAADNFKKAEEIYQRGLKVRAQPLEDLEHAHKQFGFSMSQRILYKDEPGNQKLFQSSLEERRTALTSLRAHKKRHVGTSRTGLAIKSVKPGLVLQENMMGANAGPIKVDVFKEAEEETKESSSLTNNVSIVRSLVDSIRSRENTHEPGPWNKAKVGCISGHLIEAPQQPSFKILEDDTPCNPIPYNYKSYHLGFQRPNHFVANNRSQPNDWDNVPLVISEPIDPKGIPMYSKMYCYPGNGKEYSAEEYVGYKWFKNRGLSNKFTLQYDPIWDDRIDCGIRIPPNFARQSLPQNSDMDYVMPMQNDPEPGFTIDYKLLRIVDDVTGQIRDISHEEIMREKWKLNPKKFTDVIEMDTDDLEETMIGERRASIMPRFSMMPRQSIFPERKSILLGKRSLLPDRRSVVQEENEQASISQFKLEFKTPNVPGINRKSVLPRISTTPSHLIDKHENFVNETEMNDGSFKNVDKTRDHCLPAQDSNLQEEITANCITNLGAVKKQTLHKRKIDTPDKIVQHKSVCTIDTPEKLSSKSSFTPCVDEQSNFDGFAVPRLPSPIKTKPFQIFEDDQSSVVKPEPQGSLFNQNDSICTMNFNRCIETGSMSTPIKVKEKRIPIQTPKNTEETLIESPIENIPQNISPIIPVIDQENIEPVQMPYHAIPKQLSTIMETTETTSSLTGVHTKSSISSPESGNESELTCQQSSVVEQKNATEKFCIFEENKALPEILSDSKKKIMTEDSITVVTAKGKELKASSFITEELNIPPENSMMVPFPVFSIFEDKTENIKPVSEELKLQITNKSSVNVPNFSIFEDKTENLKAISIKAPSFIQQNDTQIFNKENISRVILEDVSPSLTTFKIPNESAFPDYEEDQTGQLKTTKKQEFLKIEQKNSSIMKETHENMNNSMPIQNCTFDSTNILQCEQNITKLCKNAEKPTEIHENKLEILRQTSDKIRKSDDFYDCFGKSPVKARINSKDLAISNLTLILDKTENMCIDEKRPDTKVEDIEDKRILSVRDRSLQNRKSDDFYDLFSKSPPKLGIEKKLESQKENATQKSPDISSLLKFDISNDRDTTQALLKLNLDNSKNVSMLAKSSKISSILHVSQIKQEKSLHISDRLSTFAKPFGNFDSPKEVPIGKQKKPLFAEDDNINTMNFASNLETVQNSTFIAPPESNKPIFGILKVESGLRMSKFSDGINEEIEKTLISPKKTVSLLKNTLPIQSNSSVQNINPEESFKNILSSNNCTDTLNDDLGMSIYVAPKVNNDEISDENWEELNEDFELNAQNNDFLPNVVDLNGTRAFIQDQLLEEMIDPFNKDLIHALLDQIDFINYLTDLRTCSLRNKISPLAKGHTTEIGNETFDVVKAIGKGSYGTVFSGKCQRTGVMYALKQERPANLWEYYICLEIKSRIANPNILCGFMDVEYALIGTNASILASKFSKYGTLIDVCNKIKKSTNRNMDEYIVMHLTSQILDLMDHLHSSQIIHADVKPDNFLVMTKINPGYLSRPSIQLIDFGIAIDMQLLSNLHPYQQVQFKLIVDEDPCIEMREKKYWTYQVDLYGVAGTAHAMLFGKYMEVQQKLMKWAIKTKMPRYFHKDIWDIFFDKMLNIRSCKEMPNLQELRTVFKEELQNKEKIFREKINEFNNILESS
uniref:CSON015408 protein n=1 Tax=Culicoides sonorensis TaxID=179676 RepID=A0A336K6A5_CULSO